MLRFDFVHEPEFETEVVLARALTETGRGGGIAEIMKGEGDERQSAVIILGKKGKRRMTT